MEFIIWSTGFSETWGAFLGLNCHLEIMSCFVGEQHMMLPLTYAEAALT